MIKVFTTNKGGKIELTLDEAYWDGFRHNTTYVYQTPSREPYKWNITTSNQTVQSNVGESNA